MQSNNDKLIEWLGPRLVQTASIESFNKAIELRGRIEPKRLPTWSEMTDAEKQQQLAINRIKYAVRLEDPVYRVIAVTKRHWKRLERMSDPVYAEKVKSRNRESARRAWSKHQERMKSDPIYAAEYREKTRIRVNAFNKRKREGKQND